MLVIQVTVTNLNILHCNQKHRNPTKPNYDYFVFILLQIISHSSKIDRNALLISMKSGFFKDFHYRSLKRVIDRLGKVVRSQSVFKKNVGSSSWTRFLAILY